MRNFDKSEPFCCGRETGSLCLGFRVSSLVLTIGLGLGLGTVVPEAAQAAICFLPDCGKKFEKKEGGNINTARCTGMGYTYYETGQCPQYYAQDVCPFDSHYLKCNAEQWCKNNGYTITSCTIPQYVDTQCPNGKAFYKQCKTDNPRACRDTGYVNSCPSGQELRKNSGRCSYDSSYGTCCTPSGCPSYTSTASSSYGTNGTDGCEYTCYYTCNMDCPSSYPYSSDPTGCSSRTTNGCGTKYCYNYVSCCTPNCSSDWNCSCGTYTVSDGCGGTCTKCSSCCTRYQSCSSYCTGVQNTKPHCQTWSSSEYRLNCNLEITRDWVDCSGVSKSVSGISYYVMTSYSTNKECEAARETHTCSCVNYRYPYGCGNDTNIPY